MGTPAAPGQDPRTTVAAAAGGVTNIAHTVHTNVTEGARGEDAAGRAGVDGHPADAALPAMPAMAAAPAAPTMPPALLEHHAALKSRGRQSSRSSRRPSSRRRAAADARRLEHRAPAAAAGDGVRPAVPSGPPALKGCPASGRPCCCRHRWPRCRGCRRRSPRASRPARLPCPCRRSPPRLPTCGASAAGAQQPRRRGQGLRRRRSSAAEARGMASAARASAAALPAAAAAAGPVDCDGLAGRDANLGHECGGRGAGGAARPPVDAGCTVVPAQAAGNTRVHLMGGRPTICARRSGGFDYHLCARHSATDRGVWRHR